MENLPELSNMLEVLIFFIGFQIKVPPQSATQIVRSRKNLERAQKKYGEDSPMVVPFIHDLYSDFIIYGPNYYQAALPLLEKAYEIQEIEQEGVENSPDLATAMTKLGECLTFTGDLDRAEVFLNLAATIRTKLYGDDDPLCGYVWNIITFLQILKTQPGVQPMVLESLLSVKPAQINTLPFQAQEPASKALKAFNILMKKKYDSPTFEYVNTINYKSMMVSFRLDETLNNDYDQRLVDLGPQKGGCFIATAVYGSYDCKEVLVLRRFRDMRLQKSYLGRLFIDIYYKIGPVIAKSVTSRPKIKKTIRMILDRIVQVIKSAQKTDRNIS